METKTIAVIGGYGQVGRVICERLLMQHSNNVIAAGRSMRKAKAFSEEVDNKVTPQLIDVMNTGDYPDWLKDVDLCVMCIEQKHPNFIKFCFQHHIDYIDISPSYESLSQVMVLDELAKKISV
ncbi:saccharopine dehydrogenase NADP-binding domain-containing protein [Geomicrobium sp. JCM 19055]|uniref:saccharopine dehydrogenase NADP-binding domain-containing protein n=1 Tax=Geomicrobium sp. JCM 19055 TaxID=1460649 RepID=UPI00045EDE54|nr:saccharopine dehydrogenase NADP-binding domain-containing protein [Geomicrobium sp. JCM 19055]GAJ98939.1 hypothetical protein JCM19055_1906 [Geomicrobium sp. JCM 19055]